MTLRLTARWVLGFDGSDHRLFEEGEVLLDGDRIVHAGRRSDMPADAQQDMGAALLAPGFIDLNATADADQTIMGFGGNVVPHGKMWSTDYAARSYDLLTTEQMVAAARAAFCQLMLSGVTCAIPVTSLLFRKWAENGAEYDAVAALSGELGLRLVLGPTFRSCVNTVDPDSRVRQVANEQAGLDGFTDALSFIERNHGGWGGLVSGLVLPSTIETCSEDLLRRAADAARSLDVPLKLHCCQTQLETEIIWSRSGQTSIGHLQALGVMSERALLPHALNLGGPEADPVLAAEDRAIFASTGATVVNCPLMSARFGRRLETFGRFRDEGINIGLGTDVAPANMVMNLQAGLIAGRMGDFDAVRPADLFRAATLGGAKAIARPDLGRLAKGAAADIVAWDLSALPLLPVPDPIEALFLMPPARARHVWIAGRQTVADGKVVGINESKVGEELQAIFETCRKSFEERCQGGHPWEVLFPSSFPIQRQRLSQKPHRQLEEYL